ncbi:MAG: hypothetical protein ACYTG3_13520 [Planctomycetota bacterium]
MARFIVFAAVAALVIAFPVTHEALAGNDTKVKICHVNSANKPGVYDRTYEYANSNGYYSTYQLIRTHHLGKVIEVDDSAVAAHLAHGDSTWWYELDGDYVPSWATSAYLTTLEDIEDYYYRYENPWSGYWYEYSYTYDNVNAVIKNADCTWDTSEYIYP